MVRGLRATGTLTRGERLFVMPSHLLLNLRMVRDDPILGRMYNETPQLADGMGGLAVLLIREALNRTSFWRPYLCSLPKHVPLPVFYSPKKLARVRGGMPEEQLFKFDSLVEARRDAIELHFVSIMPVLFLKYPGTFRSSDFTYARWAWACSIIMSRTWGRPMSDPVLNKREGPNGTTVQTLVPAADMPNHLNGALEASQDHNGSLILRAHANLTAGDQLFISYGAKCSAEFIAHYGFIPSNNSAVPCKHAEDRAPGFNATAHWENATRWRRKWRATFAKLYAEVIDKAERSGRAHSSR